MITVSDIVIYPIKACGGVRVAETEIVPGGLKDDRRYMLVGAAGQFITRRQDARLAQVQLAPISGGYRTFAENAGDFELPDIPPEHALGAERSCTVWRDQVFARSFPEGSQWFQTFFGRDDIELVYLPEEELRQVNPQRAQPGDLVSFADGYPLHLTSTASLTDLNSRLEEPIPMARFRPNVVVTGAKAYEEDCWKDLQLGSISSVIPKLCDRCVVTTIEEFSATKSKEPLRTFAKYRRWDGAVWFGANLIPRNRGTLRVGDAVEVVTTGAHPAG